jgi:curved DNA-binding protein CbpA
MTHTHTHYDNLKVSRDAHPKVIRAAYMKLSRQHHPDHNPNDPEATKIMQVINQAYDVLSDPVKRREHDEWIARMESENTAAPSFAGNSAFSASSRESGWTAWNNAQPFSFNNASIRRRRKTTASGIEAKAIGDHIFKHWFWYVLAIAMIIGFGYDSFFRDSYHSFSPTSRTTAKPAKGKPPPRSAVDARNDALPYQTSGTQETIKPLDPELVSTPPPERRYSRPATAPDGNPWPAAASYLVGLEQLNANGLSTVIIDNSQNDSDVLVKLFYLGNRDARPVRTFYIPAKGTFAAERVTAGSYDVRYRDLQSGELSRSDSFYIVETPLRNGVGMTVVSMRLFKLQNGETPLLGLSEENF